MHGFEMFWGHDDKNLQKLSEAAWPQYVWNVSGLRCFGDKTAWAWCLAKLLTLEACLKDVRHGRFSWTKKALGSSIFRHTQLSNQDGFKNPTISKVNRGYHWSCAAIIRWWVSQLVKEHRKLKSCQHIKSNMTMEKHHFHFVNHRIERSPFPHLKLPKGTIDHLDMHLVLDRTSFRWCST